MQNNMCHRIDVSPRSITAFKRVTDMECFLYFITHLLIINIFYKNKKDPDIGLKPWLTEARLVMGASPIGIDTAWDYKDQPQIASILESTGTKRSNVSYVKYYINRPKYYISPIISADADVQCPRYTHPYNTGSQTVKVFLTTKIPTGFGNATDCKDDAITLSLFNRLI